MIRPCRGSCSSWLSPVLNQLEQDDAAAAASSPEQQRHLLQIFWRQVAREVAPDSARCPGAWWALGRDLGQRRAGSDLEQAGQWRRLMSRQHSEELGHKNNFRTCNLHKRCVTEKKYCSNTKRRRRKVRFSSDICESNYFRLEILLTMSCI